MNLDQLPVGTMRMVNVDGHRVCVAHTADGVYAVDHACPHQGYGVTQGTLDGNLLTCAWHNWKFDVTSGVCTMGDEDIATHAVAVAADGDITVTVRTGDRDTQRAQRLDSLRSGLERHRVGQISREVVRLLQLGESPAALVADGVRYNAPRAEFGFGHELAGAADCLAIVELFVGEQRAFPVVQALAGLAEEAHGYPEHPPTPAAAALPDAPGAAFRAAVESERLDEAIGLVRAALAHGATADDLVPWFTDVVGDHLLGYGHGAIYTQKAFELLASIGWDLADTVLVPLTRALVWDTREDTLPYARPFVRAVSSLDLTGPDLTGPVAATEAWHGHDALVELLLGPDRRADLPPAVGQAMAAGATVDELLDCVVDAACLRLLRYDVDQETDLADDFKWLDITHALTYAHAARWLHHHHPGPSATAVALWTVFLVHWTGRHEWHTHVGPLDRRASDAPIAERGAALQRAAVQHDAGSFIVAVHAVKNARAAAREAERRSTTLPLEAVERLLASPRMERFVATNVAQSIEFLTGRSQRD